MEPNELTVSVIRSTIVKEIKGDYLKKLLRGAPKPTDFGESPPKCGT